MHASGFESKIDSSCGCAQRLLRIEYGGYVVVFVNVVKMRKREITEPYRQYGRIAAEWMR
jgi:hypothetical protein